MILYPVRRGARSWGVLRAGQGAAPAHRSRTPGPGSTRGCFPADGSSFLAIHKSLLSLASRRMFDHRRSRRSSQRATYFAPQVTSGIMPKIKLTKSAIDALKRGPKDLVVWDLSLPGFGVKVTPTGRKVFIALYRTRGGRSRLRKYTIGPYGRVTLHHARAAAQRVFAARLDGRDPAAEKLELRRRKVVDRVDDLVEAFIADHLAGLRSGGAVSRLLRREVLPCWGARSVHDIKRRDISDLVADPTFGA